MNYKQELWSRCYTKKSVRCESGVQILLYLRYYCTVKYVFMFYIMHILIHNNFNLKIKIFIPQGRLIKVYKDDKKKLSKKHQNKNHKSYIYLAYISSPNLVGASNEKKILSSCDHE